MGDTTAIAWTDSTLNPWVGCQRVSPGCVNCYAETLDKRVGGGIDPADGKKKLRWGPTAPRVRTSDELWRKPHRWNRIAEKQGKRRRVFCASLADVFEDRSELVPWRAQLFEMVLQTPWLDWQLLTKRPENIRRLWPLGLNGPSPLFWPNVWLGTTVEDRERAPRIDVLREIPAAVHFISAEPLLEDLGRVDLRGIDWIICGGESGPHARPFDLAWARSLRERAKTSEADGGGDGAAFFMKQLGDNPILEPGPLTFPATAHHGADPTEWPEDLRVQEFPTARAA